MPPMSTERVPVLADRRNQRPQSRQTGRHAYTERASRPSPDASGSNSPNAPSRADGVQSYTRKRQNRTRKRVVRGVLIGLLCVLLAAGGAVAMYMGDINSRLTSGLDKQTRELLSDSVQLDNPFYMLLMGVDKSEDRVNSAEYGADESNYRADSIILARIDPKGQQVTLVSLHRDTLTDMSDVGAGTQKLNAAYSLGGPSYMIKCVEKLCGVDISHYAEVDFEQFAGIVDTIGGISVDLPIDVKDDYSGADLDAGEQTLNGEQALALARARHAYDNYGDGDVFRAANQRMVIAAIVKKVLTLDLGSMTSAISQLASGVTTDVNVSDILSLATQFKDLDVENNVYSGMEPTGGELINGTWYEKLDESAWKTMMDRVRAGQSPYSDASQDQTNGLVGSLAGDTSGTTISSDSSSGDAQSSSSSSDSSEASEYSGSAIVVNTTGVGGLGGQKSDKLTAAGFSSEATTGTTKKTSSYVVYNGDAAKAKAVGAAKTLGISTSNVEANDGTWSTAYDVLVVIGTDQE